MENGEWRMEVGSQRAEDGKTDVRRQRAEDRGHLSSPSATPWQGGRRTEDRRARARDRDQRSEIRSQMSEVRGLRAEDRGQRSENREWRMENRE